MHYTFALAGNQNSGKTTLFNQLTGSSQHVGNWPGVTVEKKTGAMLHHHHGQQTHLGLPRRFRRAHESGQAVPDKYSDVTIVDLPGIYSLSPYSMEEIVSRNFIVREKPDVVINIVDATNLERNLYLTLQLLQLGRPVVVALNMMDEVRSHGDAIDLKALEKGLGVPVVAICARRGEGLDELVRRSMLAAARRQLPARLDICSGEAHKALHAIEHLVEQPAMAQGLMPRYAATKLFEGDAPMMEELELKPDTRHIIEEILCAMEREVGMERAAVMADTRYRFIEGLLATCYTRANRPEGSLTDRIDNVLTHPVLAIPVFLMMMLLVFFITFGPLGTWVADGFSGLVDNGSHVWRKGQPVCKPDCKDTQKDHSARQDVRGKVQSIRFQGLAVGLLSHLAQIAHAPDVYGHGQKHDANTPERGHNRGPSLHEPVHALVAHIGADHKEQDRFRQGGEVLHLAVPIGMAPVCRLRKFPQRRSCSRNAPRISA